MLNCIISSKLRKPSCQLLCTSLFFWLPWEKPQLVLCFKHFIREQVLVSGDFSVDSLYRKLLIFYQICWSRLKMWQGSHF